MIVWPRRRNRHCGLYWGKEVFSNWNMALIIQVCKYTQNYGIV